MAGNLFGGGSVDSMMQGGGGSGQGWSSPTLGASPMGGPGGMTQGATGGGSVLDMLYNSPQFKQQMLSSALMNLGSGMLKASGPSSTPVSFGQALGSGLQNMQQGQDTTRDRFTKDLMLKSQLETAQLGQETQRGWREVMQRIAGGQGGGGAAAAAGAVPPNAPRPATLDEAMALPPGTLFVAPNGQLRTR